MQTLELAPFPVLSPLLVRQGLQVPARLSHRLILPVRPRVIYSALPFVTNYRFRAKSIVAAGPVVPSSFKPVSKPDA